MNPMRHAFINRCLASSTSAAATAVESNIYSKTTSTAPSTTRPLDATFPSSTLPTPDISAPSRLRILDVGCGGGIFAESAARLPHVQSVLGIDVSSRVLTVAEKHRCQDPMLVHGGKLSYRNIAVERLVDEMVGSSDSNSAGELSQQQQSIGDKLHPKPTDLYDLITIFEVLEHVPHPSRFLTSLTSLVAPGGWLVLSTIARTWTSWFVTKVMAEDVLRMVPRGTHDWKRYVNEAELREWFARRGKDWEAEKARTMGVVYVPGLGWREVPGGEGIGNYFFGVRKRMRE